MVNYKKLYAELMGTLSQICDMTKDAESFLDAEIFNLAFLAMNSCEQEILDNDAAQE